VNPHTKLSQSGAQASLNHRKHAYQAGELEFHELFAENSELQNFSVLLQIFIVFSVLGDYPRI
jgi:hypothetical protein